MRNDDTILPDITSAVRCMARIGGAILLIFAAAIYLKEGAALKFSGLRTNEMVMTMSLVAALLGLLIGWVSEAVGGMFTILGLVIFTVVNYYSGGDFAWELWVLAIPAALFIICWLRTS